VTEIELVELDESFSCYGVATEGAVYELKAIYTEMFVDNTYLQHGISLPENACVVDVGANVGIFSLFVKSQRPEARVLAFEPMPNNLRALRMNLELHGATDVEVIPHGLSAGQDGEATFTFYPNLPGNSTRYPAGKQRDRDSIADAWGEAVGNQLYQGEEVTVRIEPLSAALARYPEIERIDLLKVDVEGAELDVLEGMGDKDWERVTQIALELQDVDGMADKAVAILTERGFQVAVETPATLAHLDYRTVYARRG
jgi:FkbM family methyltransferase